MTSCFTSTGQLAAARMLAQNTSFCRHQLIVEQGLQAWQLMKAGHCIEICHQPQLVSKSIKTAMHSYGHASQPLKPMLKQR